MYTFNRLLSRGATLSTKLCKLNSKSFTSIRLYSTKTNNSHHNHNHSSYSYTNSNKYNIGSLFTIATGIAATTITTTLLLNENEIEDTRSNLPNDFVVKLGKLMGDRVVYKMADREAHGKDFSYHPPENPDAVVYPIDELEVIQIINLCQEYGVPIVPFGSGTSLEGHILAHKGGISVDFKYMKRVFKVRPDDLDVTVQPGISYDELNEELRKYGFFFAMDPGPGASIGGMVGTSCSGTHAVRYGTMKENVLSLKVVLPNGSLVKTKSRAKKSSAGYDLTHLFIGAEGTLGMVTEITLKIHPIPEKSAVAHATFANISDASQTVIKMMQSGIQIGRAELMDDSMMKAVNQSNGTDYPVRDTLLLEFTGSKAQVDDQIKRVEALATNNGALQFQFATEPEDIEKLWFARKVALWSAPVLKPGSEVIITDVCVPISRLADIITETKKDIESTSIIAPLVSHAGDGNFHLFILFDPSNKQECIEAKRINTNMVNRAIEMDGTCTGEHGVAIGKKSYLEKELGKEALELMKSLKRTIDPKNIMNPGKVIDV